MIIFAYGFGQVYDWWYAKKKTPDGLSYLRDSLRAAKYERTCSICSSDIARTVRTAAFCLGEEETPMVANA